MNAKTSVTLSEDLLAVVDELVADSGDRSEFIERAVRVFIAQVKRARADQRDREIIDRHAERLNREAADVLAFQDAFGETS